MTVRKSVCFALLLAFAGGIAGPAKAEPKAGYWAWWPEHWQDLTFKPYLEPPVGPQNSQWEEKKWEPADWSAQRAGGGKQVIRDFYRAEILSNQYVKDHVPVLEVGPNFYNLSGYDKRRVMRLIDDAYKITGDHENAMFTVTDWRTKKQIGLYTANGLQLQ